MRHHVTEGKFMRQYSERRQERNKDGKMARGNNMKQVWVSFIIGMMLCIGMGYVNADSGSILAPKKKQTQRDSNPVRRDFNTAVEAGKNAKKPEAIITPTPANKRNILNPGTWVTIKKPNAVPNQNQSTTVNEASDAPAESAAVTPNNPQTPAPNEDITWSEAMRRQRYGQPKQNGTPATNVEAPVVGTPESGETVGAPAVESPAAAETDINALAQPQPNESSETSIAEPHVSEFDIQQAEMDAANRDSGLNTPPDTTRFEVDDKGNMTTFRTKADGTEEKVETPSHQVTQIQDMQRTVDNTFNQSRATLGTRPNSAEEVNTFMNNHPDVIIPEKITVDQASRRGYRIQRDITDPEEIKKIVAQDLWDEKDEEIQEEKAAGEENIQQTQARFNADEKEAKDLKDQSDGLDRSGVGQASTSKGDTYDTGVVKVRKQFLEDKGKAINSNTTGNLAQIGQGIAASVKNPKTAAEATEYATYLSAVGGLTNAWHYGGADSLASKHFASAYETEALRDANITKRATIAANMQKIQGDCEAAQNCASRAGEMSALAADAQALNTQIAAQNSQSWSDWWSGVGNRTTGVVSLAGAGAMGYLANENRKFVDELENKKCVPGKKPTDMNCDNIPDQINCVVGSDASDMNCNGVPDWAENFGKCVPGADPMDMNCDRVADNPGPGNTFVDNKCLPGQVLIAGDCVDASGPGGGPAGGPGSGGSGVTAGGGAGGGAGFGSTLSLDDLKQPEFTASAAGLQTSAQNESSMSTDSSSDQRFPMSGGGGGSPKSISDSESQAGGSSTGTTANAGTFNIGDIGGNYGSVGGSMDGFDLSKFMPNWMPGEEGGASGLAIRQIASQKEAEQQGQILGTNSPSLFNRVTKAHMKKAHELKEEVF